MFNEKLNCYIGIPSKSRAFRVKLQERLIGKATWFVLPEEVKQYEDEGAECIITTPGLANQRNAILEEAFKNKQNCLMIDDDLIGFQMISNIKSLYDMSFEKVVKELQVSINIFKLAGNSSGTNVFWYNPNRPVSRRSPVAGIILVKPSTPRYDTNLEVSEDTDFALQHITQYGGVIKNNFIINKFHSTKIDHKRLTFKKPIDGGLDWNEDKMKRAYHYLLHKWGNKVKPGKNPLDIRFCV